MSATSSTAAALAEISALGGLNSWTSRLRTLYVLALSAVAALSIAGQMLVQWSLHRQLGDATVVNIAGRQRMLSQRIAKAALLATHPTNPAQSAAALGELAECLALWRRSHAGLRVGDGDLRLGGHPSSQVAAMFDEVEPSFLAIAAAADQLLKIGALGPMDDAQRSASEEALAQILTAEPQFLAGMDRIVFQYNREAENRVSRLKAIERSLLAVTIAVLLAEGWFVFRPAAARLREIGHHLLATTQQLIAARQEAEAASEAKSRFLANVSHELRTPLHAMLAATEMAQQVPASVVHDRHLATVADAGQLLLGLVNDLLDMAKVEAGKLELHIAPANLRQLATEVTAIFAAPAAQKGLALLCEFDPQLPPIVLVDAQRLKQALINLLGNALKFTSHGSVKLRIHSSPADLEAPRIHFAVTDTGIGIPFAEQSRIFDRFTQVDSSIRRKHSGAGLGLAISSHLIRLMGGQIAVHSAPGQGSRFAFELQLPAALSDAAQPLLQPPRPAADLAGRRVLVAEDTPFIRHLLGQSLQAWGCQVTLAASGAEALASFEEQLPDVVLLDVHMPDKDGPQVAAALRELATRQNHALIPMVAITADGLPQTRARCLASGIQQILTKPFSQRDLMSAIENALATTGGLVAPPGNSSAESEPGPTTDDQAPLPLDLDDALSRLGDRADLLYELADIFSAEVPRLISELRVAAGVECHAQVRHLAHRLRGQANVFEQGEVDRLTRLLETSPDSASRTALQAIIDELELATSDLLQRLHATLVEHQSV